MPHVSVYNRGLIGNMSEMCCTLPDSNVHIYHIPKAILPNEALVRKKTVIYLKPTELAEAIPFDDGSGAISPEIAKTVEMAVMRDDDITAVANENENESYHAYTHKPRNARRRRGVKNRRRPIMQDYKIARNSKQPSVDINWDTPSGSQSPYAAEDTFSMHSMRSAVSARTARSIKTVHTTMTAVGGGGGRKVLTVTRVGSLGARTPPTFEEPQSAYLRAPILGGPRTVHGSSSFISVTRHAPSKGPIADSSQSVYAANTDTSVSDDTADMAKSVNLRAPSNNNGERRFSAYAADDGASAITIRRSPHASPMVPHLSNDSFEKLPVNATRVTVKRSRTGGGRRKVAENAKPRHHSIIQSHTAETYAPENEAPRARRGKVKRAKSGRRSRARDSSTPY